MYRDIYKRHHACVRIYKDNSNTDTPPGFLFFLQSAFFLNYLLQDALLIVPLVDLLHVFPLFLLGVQV